MTAPAVSRPALRAGLAELLALVDVSRAGAAAAEARLGADVGVLYGEQAGSGSSEEASLLSSGLLVGVVALVRRGFAAGWAEGVRFGAAQFAALGVVSDGDLELAAPDGAGVLVRDFLDGQVATAQGTADRARTAAELVRRARLAVAAAVSAGRSAGTEAVFAALAGSLGAEPQKLWVARFDPVAPPCALCARLHGTAVALGEPFPVPSGEPAPYGGVLSGAPRHVGCGCSLLIFYPELFDVDDDAGPTPLSMRAYGEWVSRSSADDRELLVAATIVRVGSYTRVSNGKMQHVEGYFYHIESGKKVTASQARALGGGSIQTVSVKQARALRSQARPSSPQPSRPAGRRSPGAGQQGLEVGPQPSRPSARAKPRDPARVWKPGKYSIKMPSGQDTVVEVARDGSSRAVSGQRSEKATARQTKAFLDFWDGQGRVAGGSGPAAVKPDAAPEGKAPAKKVDDDPDPERDADREAPWSGDDKKVEKAPAPQTENKAAAAAEGKKPVEDDEKLAGEDKKSKTSDDSDPYDIKGLSDAELARELSEVEDELRDMRRAGLSVSDPDYVEVKQRLADLNVEEDKRAAKPARPAGAPRAKPPAVPKAADPPAAPAKPAAAPSPPSDPDPSAPADVPSAEAKPAPAPKAVRPPRAAPARRAAAPVSAADAARKPAVPPKIDAADAKASREFLARAKAADKVIQSPGDDGAALASAMQLVNSTRHKHYVKVSDDSVRVSLKHIPVQNDGSRQYLVHTNGSVWERGIGADDEETLTRVPADQVEGLVGPSLGADGALDLDRAAGNVRKLTDEQLSQFMGEALAADRIDDFEVIAAESDRREARAERSRAAHEARAAEIERLLDQGKGYEQAVEEVTGTSVEKQRRKAAIAKLREDGHTGVNFDELSRKAYRNYLFEMMDPALSTVERDTAGYWLNPEGKRRGIDPNTMFYTTDDEYRQKYISDELRDWFEENGYPQTYEQWTGDYLKQAVQPADPGTQGSLFDDGSGPDAVEELPPAAPQRFAQGSDAGLERGRRKAGESAAPAAGFQPGPVPVYPGDYQPTGDLRGRENLSDAEVDVEKIEADRKLAEAVTGGLRSNSPDMSGLRLKAKRFGEEQDRRRAAASEPVADPPAESSAPAATSTPEIAPGVPDLSNLGALTDEQRASMLAAAEEKLRRAVVNDPRRTSEGYREAKRERDVLAAAQRRAAPAAEPAAPNLMPDPPVRPSVEDSGPRKPPAASKQRPVPVGKETKRAYAERVSENVDAAVRAREAERRAGLSEEDRLREDLEQADRVIEGLEQTEGISEDSEIMRTVRERRAVLFSRLEAVIGSASVVPTPEPVSSVTPAPTRSEPDPPAAAPDGELAEMSDGDLQSGLSAARQELREMRSVGLAASNPAYQELLAEVQRMEAEKLRRAEAAAPAFVPPPDPVPDPVPAVAVESPKSTAPQRVKDAFNDLIETGSSRSIDKKLGFLSDADLQGVSDIFEERLPSKGGKVTTRHQLVRNELKRRETASLAKVNAKDREAQIAALDDDAFETLRQFNAEELSRLRVSRAYGDRGGLARRERLADSFAKVALDKRRASGEETAPEFSDRAVLEFISGENVDTAEVAEYFGVRQPQALAALNRLEKAGYVSRNGPDDAQGGQRVLSGGRNKITSLSWETEDRNGGDVLSRFDADQGSSKPSGSYRRASRAKAEDWSKAELIELRKKNYESLVADGASVSDAFVATTTTGGSDQLLDMWRSQGFADLPEVVSQEEFYRRAEQGGEVFYRGLTGDPGDGSEVGTPEEYRARSRKRAEEYRSGKDPFPGRGIHGNGTYLTDSVSSGAAYAEENGAVMEMMLRPDARVVDIIDLQDQRSKLLARWEASGRRDLIRIFGKDNGSLATMLGYDAFRVPQGNGESYLVVQNRTALLIAEQGIGGTKSRLERANDALDKALGLSGQERLDALDRYQSILRGEDG